MRIGLVVPGGVDRSGTDRVIPCLLWLIERIAREHELVIVALRQERRPSRYELLGARVHNVATRPATLRAAAELIAVHRRTPLDVIHAVWGGAPGAAAALAGRLLRCPVLLQLAGGELVALPDIGYGQRTTSKGRALLRLAVAGAHRITVPSGTMRQQAQRLGIAADRLPYGVARDRWPELPPRPRPLDRPARLLHVASLNAVKDQHTLLRALRLLRNRGANVRLDVAGEDTLGGTVQRLAASLELADAVTFHGFLRHAVLRPLVERADLLLVTSRHEAGPIALLEAAVAGVPTVGTAVGHLADWAPDAAAAVPVGDHAGLAQAVEVLLADEGRRLRMAAAAQARAIHEDADWTARHVTTIYAEMQGGGRESRA